MKTYTLDWKGWWPLRSPMTSVPALAATTAVYAVMGAKLKKVEQGIACTAREVVLFGLHRGGALKDHLDKMQKMSLGVFAAQRCQEIRKTAIVYAAALPETLDLAELQALLSLLYGAAPFAPRHHAMPPRYEGEAVLVKNTGRVPGVPEQIRHGEAEESEADSDRTSDGSKTIHPEVDDAMRAAMEKEMAATRQLTRQDVEASGLATERVAKPERPSLVETTRLEKDDVPKGLETERLPKPEVAPGAPNTEFVPRPAGMEPRRDAEPDAQPTLLDEAEG
ncbi:MAG: hypothetical protein IT463_11515 [Planctomycetes bacterium]|nr:hypothetical protein [Planctomycetota bacterium]